MSLDRANALWNSVPVVRYAAGLLVDGPWSGKEFPHPLGPWWEYVWVEVPLGVDPRGVVCYVSRGSGCYRYAPRIKSPWLDPRGSTNFIRASELR